MEEEAKIVAPRARGHVRFIEVTMPKLLSLLANTGKAHRVWAQSLSFTPPLRLGNKSTRTCTHSKCVNTAVDVYE